MTPTAVLPVGDTATVTTSQDRSFEVSFLDTLFELRRIVRTTPSDDDAEMCKACDDWLFQAAGVRLQPVQWEELAKAIRGRSAAQERWLKACGDWLEKNVKARLTLGEVDNLIDQMELEYARKKKGRFGAILSMRNSLHDTDSMPSV